MITMYQLAVRPSLERSRSPSHFTLPRSFLIESCERVRIRSLSPASTAARLVREPLLFMASSINRSSMSIFVRIHILAMCKDRIYLCIRQTYLGGSPSMPNGRVARHPGAIVNRRTFGAFFSHLAEL